MPVFKDRIKELRRVRAKELVPNPSNWRIHNERQTKALKTVLREIGYAEALVAREDDNGRLVLIDGHLRAELNPEQTVPVLVLDVTQDEADKLLLSLDPLAAMADANQQTLDDLLSKTNWEFQELGEYFDEFIFKSIPQNDLKRSKRPVQLFVPDVYQVIVECSSETEQRALFDELSKQGKKCKLLSL